MKVVGVPVLDMKLKEAPDVEMMVVKTEEMTTQTSQCHGVTEKN